MKLRRTLEMLKHVYSLNQIEEDTSDVETCLNKFDSSLKVRLCFWIIRQQKQKKHTKNTTTSCILYVTNLVYVLLKVARCQKVDEYVKALIKSGNRGRYFWITCNDPPFKSTHIYL